MKTKLQLLLCTIFIMLSVRLYAQTGIPATGNRQTETSVIKQKENRQLNFFKINLFGIPLKNYSLQYERALSKRFSVAVAYRIMPSTGLPFKNLISDAIAEEAGSDDAEVNEAKETILGLRVSGSAITPEVRLYVGKKGYGRGFYLAPFYRRATFETNNLAFNFEDENNANEEISVNLNGKFTSNTGGLLMGAQWALGKYICLDWWILGAHFGNGEGNFRGVTNQTLTPSEQEDIRQELGYRYTVYRKNSNC